MSPTDLNDIFEREDHDEDDNDDESDDEASDDETSEYCSDEDQ